MKPISNNNLCWQNLYCQKRKYVLTLLKTNVVFWLLFIIFFLYQNRVTSDTNAALSNVVNILILIIFFLSIFRVKLGLYLFIFLIPLLNSVTTILGVRPMPIILFLFFPVCLGFIISNYNVFNSSWSIDYAKLGLKFDMELGNAILIFVIFFSISFLITVFRYSNFYPFLTRRYYDLMVNVNGVKSTGSIFWTIRFFFNYIVGFGLFYIIFNILRRIKDIIISIIILGGSTLISCGVGVYQYFYNAHFGNVRYWVNINRINATFTDPNSLGAYTLLLFPVFVSLFFFFRKWQFKLVMGIVFVPFVMNMFFSGSRSAFVGLCVAIFSFLVAGMCIWLRKLRIGFKAYSIWKRLLIITPLVIVALLLGFLFFSFLTNLISGPPMSDSIRIVVDSPSSSEVLSGRVKVSGWAIDSSKTNGTGIERVEIYMKGKDIWGKEKFLGKAEYGISRPDVAKYFKIESYSSCGYSFSFDTSSLSDGTYDLYVYAYSFDGSYSYITHKINVGTMPSKNFNLARIPLIDRIYSTFQDIFKALKKDGGLFKEISSGRSTLWGQGISMFKDYPISGAGLGAYIIELPNYYAKNEIDSNLIDYVGNYYLQILSELGIAGLIAVLLIFYLIIKKAFLYFKNSGFTLIDNINLGNNLDCNMTLSYSIRNSNWLVFGFFTSFISMLVAQFFGAHTNFIEIQFTFWFIIGLLLTTIKINEENYNSQGKEHERNYYLGAMNRCWGRGTGLVSDDKKAFKSLNLTDKVKFTFSEKISLGVIILIFTVSFFISSLTTLSINVKQNLYGWENKYGFYEWEKINTKEYRWTNIDASESIDKEGKIMILPVRAGNPDIYERPLWVRVYVDNFPVRIFRVRDDLWHDVEIKLPDIDRKKVTFTISVSRSWVPEEWGLSSDSRELGISVGRIYFAQD